MRLKYEFDNVNIDHEFYAVPVGTRANEISGLLKLNHCGSVIIELLKEETTIDKIIEALAAQYENSREEITDFVHSAIDQLRELNLIVE